MTKAIHKAATYRYSIRPKGFYWRWCAQRHAPGAPVWEDIGYEKSRRRAVREAKHSIRTFRNTDLASERWIVVK